MTEINESTGKEKGNNGRPDLLQATLGLAAAVFVTGLYMLGWENIDRQLRAYNDPQRYKWVRVQDNKEVRPWRYWKAESGSHIGWDQYLDMIKEENKKRENPLGVDYKPENKRNFNIWLPDLDEDGKVGIQELGIPPKN